MRQRPDSLSEFSTIPPLDESGRGADNLLPQEKPLKGCDSSNGQGYMPTRGDTGAAYMSADDFSMRLERNFGQGGQTYAARVLGLSRSQINRYANNFPIPKIVAFALLLVDECRALGITLPDPQPLSRAAARRTKKRRQLRGRPVADS